MHSVIFLFPPVINENILLQKSVPKNMNKVQTNAGLNAGVVISEVDLGCVHEAHFSPHPMLCFCCTTCNSVFISLFVCAHSLATNTMAVNSTWQDLLQWHLMLLFIYCPHLLIYPHQVWVVCSSPPFPCEIDGSFSFRHSTCGMTEVILEVLQGQSAIKKIYISILI